MKTILNICFLAVLSISVSSCKKKGATPEHWSGADWIVGNWSCDFNACEVEGVDSSLAIFSMVTDLQILSLQKLDDGTVNTSFGWAGCINSSSGAVELHKPEADKDEYDVFFVPYDPAAGLTGVEPYLLNGIWYLPGCNFNWSTLLPEDVSPNTAVLNQSKIYLKKVSDTKMSMDIFYSDGSFKQYNWIKS